MTIHVGLRRIRQASQEAYVFKPMVFWPGCQEVIGPQAIGLQSDALLSSLSPPPHHERPGTSNLLLFGSRGISPEYLWDTMDIQALKLEIQQARSSVSDTDILSKLKRHLGMVIGPRPEQVHGGSILKEPNPSPCCVPK